ncbi:MAG TPA: MerR family transcriptional regulator [Clostridia bacterium]|jgi:flagellar operon protein (TIGR03826 family)|nr:MerR family transcriptional regulator [Clostridia bacterium]
MDLRNCPECGKIFNFLRTNLCPECQKKDEQCFRTVRRYIAQHPGVSAIEVSKNTGVSEEKVLHFLRQGRLSIGTEKQARLGCELCGKPALGERYCVSCKDKLTSGLKKAVDKENEKVLENMNKRKQTARMYTADLRKKRHQ